MVFLNTEDLRDGEIALRLERTAQADPEKRFVPAYYFQIRRVADDVQVGGCDLRIGNTERLYFGGNIGYTVYEAYRGNHYAGKACLLLLRLARRHELPYLHITCRPDNTASRRTCEYAGGQLQCTAKLPTDNDLYFEKHEREVCVYYFEL